MELCDVQADSFMRGKRHLDREEPRNDSTRPIGDLWRRAVARGHGGAMTRRPSPATRRRYDDDEGEKRVGYCNCI